MKDRGHSQGLADCLQAVACLLCRFRLEEAGLGAGLGIAACGEDQDVVLDQFPDHADMAEVLGDLGVVAAHHGTDAPDAAALDGVY